MIYMAYKISFKFIYKLRFNFKKFETDLIILLR